MKMKRIIWLLTSVMLVFGSPANADRNDDRALRVFESFRLLEGTTFKYPDGSAIARADLTRILGFGNAEATLIDKGAAFSALFKARASFAAKRYSFAATDLNADIVLAASGAPGAVATQWSNPTWQALIAWPSQKAAANILDKSIDLSDSAYPGLSSAYNNYGKFASSLGRYADVQQTIKAAGARAGETNLNVLVGVYLLQVTNPAQDSAALGQNELGVRVQNLQTFVNTFPVDNRINVLEFCRAAWRLNQLFTKTESAEHKLFQSEIARFKASVNARSKAYFDNRLSVLDATIVEGNGTFRDMVFTVTLTEALPYDVSAKYTASGITAVQGSDFGPIVIGRAVVRAGQTKGIFNIRVVGDKVEEVDERFRVVLSDSSGVLIGDKEANAVIKDDDYAGKISVSDVSVVEGNSASTSARVQVSFSQPALHDISVNYATQNGTASAGSDYSETRGTLLFKPGRLVLTVLVTLIGDTVIESDEDCFVNILVTGLPVQKSRSVLTIVNDDAEPLPSDLSVSVADVAVSEGNSGQNIALFTVQLNQPAPRPIDVDYATQDQTAFSSGDYLARSGRLVFGTGQSSVIVSVPVVANTQEEADKSFLLKLSRIGGLPGDTSAIGTIRDDDYAGTIHMTPYDGYDGSFASYVRFVVQLSSPPLHTIEIGYVTQDGTAQAPGDYVAKSGTLLIQPDTANYAADLVVDLVPDTIAEDNETLFLQLSAPGYSFHPNQPDGRAMASILNDDKIAPPPPATGLSLDGKIVFSSGRDGENNLYVMNANGTQQTKLLASGNGNSAVVSPDGKKIAYTTGDSIYSVDADGTGKRLLVSNRVPLYPGGFSPDGSKIIFSVQNSGYSDIYLMNADGSEQKQLTDSAGGTKSFFSPSFSPDGRKIVFASARNNEAGRYTSDIYTMNLDGSGEVHLTSDIHHDSQPRFSPDGSKIVYSSYRKDDPSRGSAGHYEIWLMNADGTNQHLLSALGDTYPTYSPDGQSISFMSSKTAGGDGAEIYVMSAEGANAQRLTNLGGNSAPFWAPKSGLAPQPDNGSGKIAFSSYIGGGDPEIYVMNADGTRRTRLTSTAVTGGRNLSPSFSSDGSKIVFVSHSSQSNYDDIWIMNADGTELKRLTSSSIADGHNTHPRFSPDGSKIVFTSDRASKPQNFSGLEEIYVMNSDGSNPVRVTLNSSLLQGGDSFPHFSPDGQKIIFSVPLEISTDYTRRAGAIWTVNLDGSGRTRLIIDGNGGRGHYYSRDGQKIVFVSNREDSGDGNNLQQIYVMNADGNGQKRITQRSRSSSSPCFSPDGSKIAFSSSDDLGRHLWIINVDGSGQISFNDVGTNLVDLSWGVGSVPGPVMSPRPVQSDPAPSAGSS